MANYSANDRSERILQSRRFTTSDLNLAQEAFTSVLDIGAYEIYTDDGLIPSASSQLPFSGSSQNGLIVSASQVDPGNYTEGVNDLPILKYYYRHRLKRGAVTEPPEEQVFYFTEEEATTSGGGQFVSDNQLIENDQLTNFISPKYLALAGDTVNVAETGNPGGAGYKVVVYVSDSTTASGITEDAADPNNYVFDYKTGVLSWKTDFTPASTKHVYITAYQYIGRTLRSQIDDGSIGGGAGSWDELTGIPTGLISSSVQVTSSNGQVYNDFSSSIAERATDLETASGSFSTRVTDLETDSGSFSTRVTALEENEVHTAAAISGSTRIYISGSDDGFELSNDSTLNFVSGTAGLTVVSSGSDTITIGDSADDVTFNSVTADTLTGTASFANKVVIAEAANSLNRAILVSKTSTHSGGVAYNNGSYKLTYNTYVGLLKMGGTTGNHLNIYSHSFEGGPDITTFDLLNNNTTTINFGGDATNINMGAANGTVNIAGSASIAGDLIVQGAVTSINTAELNVEDQFILLNSGSNTLQDGGIIVSSGPNNSGSAFYYDANSNRWALTPKNTTLWDATSEIPRQYIVSVSASAAAPSSTPLDFGSSNEYYGMMHVNTDNGDIYIYS